MDAYLLAFISAVVVIALLVTQIKKITDRLDKEAYENGENVSQNSSEAIALISANKYMVFCEAIRGEINWLKGLDDSELKQGAKDEFKNGLDEIDKKLKFIEMMNSKKGDKQRWEGALFELLASLEEVVSKACERGEEINDAIRERLKDKF